ncbi:MAG: thiamine phosphate synthase [Longimicrobiales bacterium]
MIPKLHVVTDDEILARPDFEIRAREVCEVLETREPVGDAVDDMMALHIRGGRTTGRKLTRLARILREPTTTSGVVLLVNDRLDVALAVGAAGVHLGARSVPPLEARRLLGLTRLVGVSVHNVREAVEAAEAGADYLFVGTLFETPSHAGAAKGAEFMGVVASRVDLPLIGIGGVTPDRGPAVLAAGGHGVAAIRGIWDAPSPPDAVLAYLDAMKVSDPGTPSHLR